MRCPRGLLIVSIFHVNLEAPVHAHGCARAQERPEKALGAKAESESTILNYLDEW